MGLWVVAGTEGAGNCLEVSACYVLSLGNSKCRTILCPSIPLPETILFVEDEALVRMDMAEFLRECGYRVHEAANASEAVEALQSKFAVDLVFTDINCLTEWTALNSPSGFLPINQGVGVVVEPAALRGAESQKRRTILAKPYTGRDLLDHVKRALEQ